MASEPLPIDRATLRRRVLEGLESEGSPRERLIGLVHLLDGVVEAHLRRGAYDDPVVHSVQGILAHAVVATGDALLAAIAPEARANVTATIEAARAFTEAPSESAWDVLFDAATHSYPFGPGEGCHALRELGGHGAFGAGCVSGAGFLDAVASVLGDAAVMTTLREHLAPRLRSETP